MYFLCKVILFSPTSHLILDNFFLPFLFLLFSLLNQNVFLFSTLQELAYDICEQKWSLQTGLPLGIKLNYLQFKTTYLLSHAITQAKMNTDSEYCLKELRPSVTLSNRNTNEFWVQSHWVTWQLSVPGRSHFAASYSCSYWFAHVLCWGLWMVYRVTTTIQHLNLHLRKINQQNIFLIL